jgi:hypothetical protein
VDSKRLHSRHFCRVHQSVLAPALH